MKDSACCRLNDGFYILPLYSTANTDMGGHVIVLVGNKADLEDSRQVPRETAEQLAEELDIR